MFEYRAMVERVVDGDTMDLLVDLGFSVHVRQRVRLYGIDTPETRTRDLKEKARGLAAKSYVVDWVMKHPSITVRTYKDKRGKFGRILAIIGPEVDAKDKETLNMLLLRLGLAVVYRGGKRK